MIGGKGGEAAAARMDLHQVPSCGDFVSTLQLHIATQSVDMWACETPLSSGDE